MTGQLELYFVLEGLTHHRLVGRYVYLRLQHTLRICGAELIEIIGQVTDVTPVQALGLFALFAYPPFTQWPPSSGSAINQRPWFSRGLYTGFQQREDGGRTMVQLCDHIRSQLC
jgi:hypothetical protein